MTAGAAPGLAGQRPVRTLVEEETTMRPIKKIKDVPFFPLIPFLPAALLVGSLATAIGALVKVRRLECQLNATQA
jgi:hypothetical protein